jgi:archaeoflavoprotein AfpA
MKNQEHLRLIWGITGAGDLLSETFKMMESLKTREDLTITAVLSQAALFVVKTYGFWGRLEKMADKILVEKNANSPFIAGDLQTGKYDLFLVAPATGNSVAKIVHGISDSLITNCVAMANKTLVPIFILPVEQAVGKIQTILPDGRQLWLFTREVDAENTKRLVNMSGITTLKSPGEIQGVIDLV